MFGVTILGNNSALPAYDRHPSAQVVTLDQYQFLVDCGEGTQMQLARYKIRRSKINHIFISHLHGDHYFGLPGLITSMGLLGRETDLHLYAPAPLKEIIDKLLVAADTHLPYPLHFHAISEEGILVDEVKFTIECFSVFHRIPCWGFIFREKKKARKINKEAIHDLQISSSQFEQLKEGHDIELDNGQHIRNEELTTVGSILNSYAYCADTIYHPIVAEKVKDVTMIYHETTYLKELEERASLRFHSTTVQAADIALKANVKRLLIGHFSSKYETLDIFLEQAREIFPTTDLAIEGVTFRVNA